MLGSYLRAFYFLATLSSSLAILSQSSLAQTRQEIDWCVSNSVTEDQTIRGCTAAIVSGKFQGAALAQAFRNRGWAYANQKDLDRALEDYNDAIRADRSAMNFNARGYFFQKRKRDYDRAIADFSEAIRIDPRHAWAYHNRAATWHDKGDSKRALEDVGEALRIDPKMASVYVLRAGIMRSMNEHDRAVADYNEAIRLAPQETRYVAVRDAYVHRTQMNKSWMSYLKEIQDDQDYANWSGPPLDSYDANTPRRR